jgi:hypothetical protein
VNRLLAAVLLVGACAAAPARQRPAGSSSEDAQETEILHEKLRSLDVELNTLATEAVPPDCGQVEALHSNICALAARICQIAERQPVGSPVRARCDDGRARCKSAGERARGRGCLPQK